MTPDFRKGWYAGYIVATILYIIVTIFLHAIAAHADNCDTVECLIALQAKEQGIPVEVALAVAKVESSLNQSAIGPFGEIGVFQIRPEYTTANIYDLKVNIKEGVRQLKHWKAHCPVQQGVAWVNCYNAGYRHPKYPMKRPYVQKVVLAMEKLK